MDTKKLNDWMQILTSVGVILSLIFVGLQIQQSREIAIADIYQQPTAILIQQLGFSMPPEVVHESWRKARAGEDLSPEDDSAINVTIAARIAYWENNHFQFQMGLMSAEQWNASLNAMRWSFQTYPETVEIWRRDRLLARKSFAEAVDALLDEIQTEN